MIITAGIVTIKTLSSTAGRLDSQIAKVESSTKSGDWNSAKTELASINESWSDVEKVWTILIDHFEIDNIATSLSKMEKYIDSKDTPLALAEAATLRQLIKHIPDKESVKLKNIF